MSLLLRRCLFWLAVYTVMYALGSVLLAIHPPMFHLNFPTSH